MQMPKPYWETIYSRSRRSHAHRCVCCNRIIQESEAVLMCRKHKGTIAIHSGCAENPYGAPGTPYTYRDFMEVRGMEHLAATAAINQAA